MTLAKKRQLPAIHEWSEHTWYLVEVAFCSTNPIHRALFYSGFLNGPKNGPGGYSGFVALNYAHSDERLHLGNAYYCRIVKSLFSTDEAETL